MMQSWLRSEQRRVQFDRHQHEYWYREGRAFYTKLIPLRKDYEERE